MKIQNIIIYSLICCLMTGLLAGCAGTSAEMNTDKEVLKEDNSVTSGGAVSGEAVSEKAISVTEEPALESREKERTAVTTGYDISADTKKARKISSALNVTSFNALCNSTNYYELDNGDDKEEEENDVSYIYEKSLDGAIVQKHQIKDDIISLLWADDRELFYTMGDTLYCVPIQKTKADDKVQWKKTAKVLKLKEEYDEIYEGDFYADENYILFINTDYKLKLYDRKKAKYAKIKGVSDKICFLSADYFDDFSAVRPAMWNGIFILCCKYKGIYSYRLGDDRVKRIVRGSHDENGEELKKGQAVYASYPQTFDDKSGKLYYQTSEISETGQYDPEDENLRWMVYGCRTGKKSRISGSEVPVNQKKAEVLKKMKQFIKEKKISEDDIDIKVFEKNRCYLEYSYEVYKDEDVADYYCCGYYDLKKDRFVELVRR